MTRATYRPAAVWTANHRMTSQEQNNRHQDRVKDHMDKMVADGWELFSIQGGLTSNDTSLMAFTFLCWIRWDDDTIT